MVVFIYYPQFADNYKKLEDVYFTKGTECLTWLKCKKSLSEYFGNQRKGDNKWEPVEKLFDVNDLKNSFSTNGNAFKRKDSKNYEELKIFLDTP